MFYLQLIEDQNIFSQVFFSFTLHDSTYRGYELPGYE